ncbi:MAG: spore cortex biosynthesis protein YabQ [Lachnospiraceae bacterium]|nr:spore cortex biosynthesis protein YabQ [Lachnospiraceae bacterium]
MLYGEIIKQAQLFGQAVGIGAVLLLLYDMLRVWRRIVRHRVAGMAVEDLLFWLFCALWLFGFMYRQNDGVIRGFIILGAAVGMFLYSILLSRRVVKAGTAALGGFFRIAGRILRMLTAPLRKLGGFCRSRMQKAGCRGKRHMRRMKKIMVRAGRTVKIGIKKL